MLGIDTLGCGGGGGNNVRMVWNPYYLRRRLFILAWLVFPWLWLIPAIAITIATIIDGFRMTTPQLPRPCRLIRFGTVLKGSFRLRLAREFGQRQALAGALRYRQHEAVIIVFVFAVVEAEHLLSDILIQMKCFD